MKKFWILAALLLPALAFAQSPEFEITPYVGYRAGGGIEVKDSQLTGRFTDVDISRSGTFGVRLNMPWKSRPGYQFELLAAQQKSQLEDIQSLFGENPGGPVNPGDREFLNIRVAYLHGGLLKQWGPPSTPKSRSEGQMHPYVAAGAGFTHIGGELPIENAFLLSFNGGGGLKMFVTERMAIRFEGRAYFTETFTSDDRKVKIENKDCVGECVRTYSYPSLFIQAEITAGLTWVF